MKVHVLPSILLVTLAATAAAAEQPAARQPRVEATSPSLTTFSKALESLADRVSQSVVQIVVVGYAPASEATSSDTLFERQRSTGSGVIVDSAGYIVTNHHVVEGARRVQVMLPTLAIRPPVDRSCDLAVASSRRASSASTRRRISRY